MKRLLGFTLVLATAVTIPAAAQTFGELFPLTNTRYRAAVGGPKLATNDHEFFLFWSAEYKIRATRLNDGVPRTGHVIFDESRGFDVAWMGDRFLAVSSRTAETMPETQQLIGQYLDADARPSGATFAITSNGRLPRIARGPASTLVVYATERGQVRSLLLGPKGQLIGADSQHLATEAYSYAVSATDDGFVIVVVNRNEVRSVALNREGAKLSEQTLVRGENYYRAVAIASNGTSHLAVWSSNEEIVAATIDKNGAFGAPLVLETESGPDQPSAVWNGAGWTVTYATTREQQRARIVQLDFAGQRVLATEESGDGIGNPSVAALDGRILAAWRPNYAPDGVVSVFELPLAQNEPRVVTYTATQQTLLATASSAEATLVVWREHFDGRVSIHAGVRTHAGRWTERVLDSGVTPLYYSKTAIAASDGTNFAVAINASVNSFLYRLDGDGQLTGEPLPLLTPLDVIAWNGTHYALIGFSSEGGLRGLLVGRTGPIAASVHFPEISYYPTALASDGNGFLLAGEFNDCQFLLCFPQGPYFTRLGPNLQRVDANDIEVSDNGNTLAGALWNGSEYVLVWNRGREVHVTRVPASGGSIQTAKTTLSMHGQDLIALSDGNLALLGNDEKISQVAILRENGTVVRVIDVDDVKSAGRKPLIEPLPDGGMALVASRIHDEAPHHGTHHVMMTIARSTPLPRPDAPHVKTRIEGNYISIDWSTPPGTINGYRIEYRVDDGSWNEIEDFYSPGAQHTSIRKPDFGSRFAIRMRAFNDAGASAYSAVTITNPGRRRAVR
jgi:hypothetical protein